MQNYQNDFIQGIGNTPLIKLKKASEIGITNAIENTSNNIVITKKQKIINK